MDPVRQCEWECGEDADEPEGILIGGRDKGSVGCRLEFPSESAPLTAATSDEKSDFCRLWCFDGLGGADAVDLVENPELVGLGVS